MMIEAVLFDFDGTLVDFFGSDREILRRLLASTGSTVPFDDFMETSIQEVMRFHDLVAEQKMDPLRMQSFRLKNTFEHHNIPWRDAYLDDYRRNLLELSVPFDGARQLLEKVRQKAKTGLVTNAYDGYEQRKRIRHAGIADLFDVIVVAGEIDLYKPDPEIFFHALDRLHVSSDKALYIGDSITYDIEGAKSAGLKTVLFSQRTRLENPYADYSVLGMAELDALMERVL
jgi:HAD superfamily hydrolase (TIGR01509 family)